MSKRKLIISPIICSLVIIISIVAIFGAFLFEEKATVNNDLAYITTINKGFVTYAPGEVTNNAYTGIDRGNMTTDAFLTALKQRKSKPQNIDTSSIVCYATEKIASNEENNNRFYLNQLGFRFDVAASLDIFVRIHFEDAWILQKTVGVTTLPEQYIRKAALNESYPFQSQEGDKDWYFDSHTNSVYYKHVIDSDEETENREIIGKDDSNNPIYGNYIHSFSYDVNPNYFYINPDDAVINGHQAVLVEVSFAIEVVQANRAHAIWGVDPLTIGN